MIALIVLLIALLGIGIAWLVKNREKIFDRPEKEDPTIESQIQVLKDNLNNQGVKVEAIEVNVSQFGFRQNTESGSDAQSQSKQQKKSGVRRINLDNFSEEAENVSDEEALAAKVLRDNGGTVDYTAQF